MTARKTPKPKAKRKKGRPTVRTASLAKTICSMIAEGHSLREICLAPNMPGRTTVKNWVREDESFRAHYARAMEARADHYVDEIIEISDDGSNDWMERNKDEDGNPNAGWVLNHEHVARSKLRVDSRKWLMGKLAPKKYGEKIDVAHSGEIKTASPEVIAEFREVVLKLVEKTKATRDQGS